MELKIFPTKVTGKLENNFVQQTFQKPKFSVCLVERNLSPGDIPVVNERKIAKKTPTVLVELAMEIEKVDTPTFIVEPYTNNVNFLFRPTHSFMQMHVTNCK